MAGNIVQVVAAAVQAVANVGDAGANLGSLATTTVNAKPTLKNSHSRMAAKMIKLHTIRRSLEDQFRIYWFPRKRFDSWLSEVERIELQVTKLKEKFSNFDRTWGIHPYTALTEEIKETRTEIDDALREGKKLEDDLVKPETRRIVELATPISIANISPLNEKLEQLLEYLKDQSYDTIRVHGVAGTGKRVLIQHVNNHEAIANNMFDIVLWLPASDYENHDKDHSIEVHVQHIIARRLGLDVRDITDVGVLASKIRRELDGTKYLLLLDDLKSNIELETIGIPRNKNGSKIVFTTYLRHVFPFGPLTPSTQFFNIEVKRLTEADSWHMFEDILTNENDTIQQHEIGTIARKVVKWCDGLFSLIYIVAQNFKSKRSPQNWSDGLQMLKSPAKRGDIYKKPLESFLNFSYGGLEENKKLCFLFTVLYPEGSKIPIDCLFDCWTTHKLLVHGVPESSRVTAQDILEHLLAMALLDEGSNKRYVTIDKVFRKAAMAILQEHNQYKFLVAEEALEKLKNDNCKDTHWISLSDSKIDDLPDEVDCPKLTTLFLQKQSKLGTISSSFFKKMNDLIILDLYKTGSEMMIPLSDLQKLKVLYVNGCAMSKELPFKIEGLDHMLEVLDIRGRIINKLPQDIEKLKHLRRLMVSIHQGGTLHLTIGKLSSLKELIIDVKSDVHINTVIENFIERIDTLKELTTVKFCLEDDIVDVIQVRGDTLKIFVPKQRNLLHILKERNIQHSALQVYIGVQMTPNLEIPKYFHKYDNFVLTCDKIVTDPVIEKVLLKVKALIMMKDNSVEHLDQIIAPHIHSCLVQRCNKIVTLIQTDGFSNLKTLVLSKCSQLKVLFSNKAVQQLISLKYLEIRDCPTIEEINMLSANGGDILPKLTTLVLHDLHMLKKICSDKKWPSLSTLEIHKCPKLTKLPLNENSAKNLHNIRVERMWWRKLESGVKIRQKFERCCKFSD